MNWQIVDDLTLISFAENLLTDKQFYGKFKGSENGGIVRNLLRDRGVEDARRLARRALQRRKNKSLTLRNHYIGEKIEICNITKAC